MIDPVDERLDFAKELGVEYTINPTKEDIVDKVREYTKGRMS